MVIRCAKCGTDNPDRAASCKKCGKSFYFPEKALNKAPVKYVKNKCPECGTKKQREDLFCPTCGYKFK